MVNIWTVGEHQIRVEKTARGAFLYVDGELLDTTNDLYASGDEPTLVGVFGEKDARVEVFLKPSPTSQVTIWVNGESISDQRYALASD